MRTEVFNGSLHVHVDEGQGEWKALMLGVDALALDACAWHQEPSVY
jgi:hypothetical protein